MDIPDKNGNITRYSTNICTIETVKSNEHFFCPKRSSDSKCLSNKCFENYCVYNEETPIVNCTDINSILDITLYMQCGKPPGNPCKTGLVVNVLLRDALIMFLKNKLENPEMMMKKFF